jgi:CubicO group peptidase (beta-lactamase class C family)
MADGDLQRASLANWMRSPHNRWAFRHVDQLIQTERIECGSDHLVLSEAHEDGLELLVPLMGGDPAPLGSALEQLQVDGIVVLHGRTVRFESYAPHADPDDRHILFSVSKSITGLLAGALAGAGRLDLEADVTSYVPEVASSGYAGASVRHLLDMTASIDLVEDYGPDADFVTYSEAGGWGPGPARVDIRGFLAGVRPGRPHGQRFDYLSPSIDLLGWVCENAAGSSFAEAVSRYIWIPMGAQSDATVTVDERGLARAAGGISATLRDTARVGRLVLEGGGGSVPRSFLDDLSGGTTASEWAAGVFTELFPQAAYRSCWYQPRVGEPVLCAIGIHGQYIYVDLERDVVVAMVSSRSTPDDDAADQAAVAIAARLSAELSG